MLTYTVSNPCVGTIADSWGKTRIDLIVGSIQVNGGMIGKLIAPDYNSGEFLEGMYVEIQDVAKDTKPEDSMRGVLFVNCREIPDEELERRPRWDDSQRYFLDSCANGKINIRVWASAYYKGTLLKEDDFSQIASFTPVSFRVAKDAPYSGESVLATVTLEEGRTIEVRISPHSLKFWPLQWKGLPGAVLAERVLVQQSNGRISDQPTALMKRW